MSRTQTILYFLICLTMGIWLFVLPWTPVWGRNFFAQHHPLFAAMVNNYFVRGAVSGLGVADIILAFYDLWRPVGRASATSPR